MATVQMEQNYTAVSLVRAFIAYGRERHVARARARTRVSSVRRELTYINDAYTLRPLDN